uniref:Ion_trans_2 domain-containing protein n=1 Tax=Heterorhabditis bacteriophora TaxID=37862 RepID=A0A1I7XUK2_HETBA
MKILEDFMLPYANKKIPRLDILVTVAIFAIVGWTSLGCLIVHIYMPHIETSVAFYFIFNSLTTIGVGDSSPRWQAIETHPRELASFDSYDDMILNDSPLNHFTTLGIIQADIPHSHCVSSRISSPEPVILPYPKTSYEDVNDLIVETYGTRTAIHH